MKKLLGALVGLLLLAGCAAPASTPANDDPTASGPASAAPDEPKADVSENPSEEPAEEPAAERQYVVTIDDSRVSKTYDGKPALIVDFTFTNNSDESASFMFTANAKAFQDGIELESAIIGDDKKYDSGAAMKDIKPGKSLKVQAAYVLDNKKADVEVEVTELISFDDTPLATKTLKLK